MIGLEQVRNRLKILEARTAPLKAEIDQLALVAEPDAQQIARFNELAAGLQVMQGRYLECEAWIEMLEKYPGVSRPDQLPTKGNTPAYVPVTEKAPAEQVERNREASHQRDARELVELLPAAGAE